MKVQKYERQATPLNYRIRYILKFMFWLSIAFFVFVAIFSAFLEQTACSTAKSLDETLSFL